jgi:CRISPR/Cas system Type II protein with McrA/HNH and RuvC-like nuclease domain
MVKTNYNIADRVKQSARTGMRVRAERISYSQRSTTQHGTYGQYVEYLDQGTESMPQACRQALVQAKAHYILKASVKG